MTEAQRAQQIKQADKLTAAAEWFTDCKTLTLEQLPEGFIAALLAGAEALRQQHGRCQDCGKRDRYRVNHPSGPLCYTCVRERILAERSSPSGLAETLKALEAKWDERAESFSESAMECSGTGEKDLERADMRTMNEINQCINDVRALRAALLSGEKERESMYSPTSGYPYVPPQSSEGKDGQS